MKKSLLFAAMAAVAFASCTNDDVVEVNRGEGIFFRASLDKAQTRGVPTTLQTLGMFKVTGAYKNKPGAYFYDMVCTSDDNGASWKSDPKLPWVDDELAFFAYAGVEGEAATDLFRNSNPYTVPTKVSEQNDILCAYNTGTKAANENTGVPLNFKHVLSQIDVKAKCSNKNMKIEILGVRIVNAATSAKFTAPETETTSSYVLAQSQWSDWSGKDGGHEKAYYIKGNSPVTLTADAQSIMFGDDKFMLLPQQLTKWAGNADKTGAYLSVLCRISSVDNNGIETLLYPQPTDTDKKDGKYAFSAVPINTNWEPGKKYTYTLNFCGDDGGGGQVDPDPDPTDPDVDPDPTDDDPGDPILGKPIYFTVTVDDWQDQELDIDMQ